MITLGFTFLLVIVSIGLIISAVTMRSRSLATLNFLILAVATAAVAPWSTLTTIPPVERDARLLWDASSIWAVFFSAAIITLAYCLFVTRVQKPPPPRRRRRRSRSGGTRNVGAEQSDRPGVDMRGV